MATPNSDSVHGLITKIKHDVDEIIKAAEKGPGEDEQRKLLPKWLQPIHGTFNSIQTADFTGDGKDLTNLDEALDVCLDAAGELSKIVVLKRKGKNGKDATAVIKELLQGTIAAAEDPLLESEEIKDLIEQLKAALKQVEDLQKPKDNSSVWNNYGNGPQNVNTGKGVQNNNSGAGQQFNGTVNGYHGYQKPDSS